MAMQSVQRVTLAGAVQDVVFDKYCGKYLVKNFSSADLYVSFSSDVGEETSIKIPAKCWQVCIINEKYGDMGQDKAKTIYLNGTGEVEVQQLWY